MDFDTLFNYMARVRPRSDGFLVLIELEVSALTGTVPLFDTRDESFNNRTN